MPHSLAPQFPATVQKEAVLSRWLVRSPRHATVVEAATWLEAVPEAAFGQGYTEDDLSPLVVRMTPEGEVRLATRHGDPIYVTELTDETEIAFDPVHVVAPDSPAELPSMPARLHGAILQATREIGEAPAKQAPALTLKHSSALLAHDSGSVLLVTDKALRFSAAIGPQATGVRNLVITPGFGICGAVYRTGRAVLVNEVSHSSRHLHAIDQETGYRPRSVLAVPLLALSGENLGVLELLDQHRTFAAWEVDVARSLARALVTALLRNA